MAVSPPKISNAEWEIMKLLWENGPMAARDVFARLPQTNDWAYKTVKTLLSRLVAKGAVGYEQVGNSYLYRAAYTRTQMTRKEVKGFVERVLEGAAMPVMARFIEQHDLSQDDIDHLRKLLDEKERSAISNPDTKKRS